MVEYVPGLAGVPAARSAVSFVAGEDGILEYRGIRIETLSKKSTYEEVAYLLLFGKLPTQSELDHFTKKLGDARQIPSELTKLIQGFPKGGHPMDVLQTGVAALGMFSPGIDYEDVENRKANAIEIIAKVPTIMATFHRYRQGLDPIAPDTSLSHAADFIRVMTGETPDELSAHVMDVCLILHADHTLNASTFTARVTASTGADPYTVVSSAIGSLSGPLHGGANERVLALLRKIGSKDKVHKVVGGMIERHEKIMGLGHRVYKTKDPRATILQALATELFAKTGTSDIYDIAVELEEFTKDTLGARGIYPNVDFYSGIVYDKLAIPTDVFTPIFAVSRVAGWLAHWLEQMEDNRIFRPRQVYEGVHETPYVPIADRS